MRQQIVAIGIGVVAAVVVIYAVFDQRVSFRKTGFSGSRQSQYSPH